jgi:hypothetical protein
MATRGSRALRRLERFADRPSYPLLVAAVAATDYFVPGSPSNTLLVASVLPRPARWRTLGVAFAVGCALGAFLLATLMASIGEPFAAWVNRGEAAELWRRIELFAEAYGLLALAALAVSPFPVRIIVAVLALSGAAPLVLGGIVLSGRLVVYPAIAWLAARVPGVLARLLSVLRVEPLIHPRAGGSDQDHPHGAFPPPTRP